MLGQVHQESSWTCLLCWSCTGWRTSGFCWRPPRSCWRVPSSLSKYPGMCCVLSWKREQCNIPSFVNLSYFQTISSTQLHLLKEGKHNLALLADSHDALTKLDKYRWHVDIHVELIVASQTNVDGRDLHCLAPLPQVVELLSYQLNIIDLEWIAEEQVTVKVQNPGAYWHGHGPVVILISQSIEDSEVVRRIWSHTLEHYIAYLDCTSHSKWPYLVWIFFS